MLPKDQRLKNWITNLQLSPKASLFAEAPQEELPGFREVMEQYAAWLFPGDEKTEWKGEDDERWRWF